MVGAFIGDLAAWTWLHDKDNFYPHLVSEVAEKSVYSDVMLSTAQTLIENPNITREEFVELQRNDFRTHNSKICAEFAMIRSIVIGWLFDDDNIYQACRDYCLCDDKEDMYATSFLSKLIFALRSGATKNAAAQVNFCGSFWSFTQEEHWKNGNGPMGYLVRTWMSFYDAFDYGSTIHNAARQSGNTILNCILAGALADAMYGSDIYYVKKQYSGGGLIQRPSFLSPRIYQISRERRCFSAKNNVLTNVDRHIWKSRSCPLGEKILCLDQKNRIWKTNDNSSDLEYGLYLDDGWIYVYGNHCVFSRFFLEEQQDGTYRIRHYQIADENETSLPLVEAFRTIGIY